MTLIKNAVFATLVLLLACNLKPVKETSYTDKIFHSNVLDTSKFTIITLRESENFAFDSSYLSTELTEFDLLEVKSLLFQSIQEYNSSVKKENLESFGVDTVKYQYKFQLIPALNKKGEKEVWINAFCSDYDVAKDWKTKMLFLFDGGNCFFNLKINLTQKKYYDFSVNGYA